MVKTKLTLHRQVSYGIAPPPPDDAPETKMYNRVIVSAKQECADPKDSTKTVTSQEQLVVELPATGWSDDDVLAAIRKAYPECEIDWLAIGENV